MFVLVGQVPNKRIQHGTIQQAIEPFYPCEGVVNSFPPKVGKAYGRQPWNDFLNRTRPPRFTKGPSAAIGVGTIV